MYCVLHHLPFLCFFLAFVKSPKVILQVNRNSWSIFSRNGKYNTHCRKKKNLKHWLLCCSLKCLKLFSFLLKLIKTPWILRSSFLFGLQRCVTGIQDQEVAGISLTGSSWPLTNYLIKLRSNTFLDSALLLSVNGTEWTQITSIVNWMN